MGSGPWATKDVAFSQYSVWRYIVQSNNVSSTLSGQVLKTLFESVCCWVTATTTILNPQLWHCDSIVSQSSPLINLASKPLLLPWLATDHVYPAVSWYFSYCCRDLVLLVSLVTGAVVCVLFCSIKLLPHCVSAIDSYSFWNHNIKNRCECCVLFQLFLDSTRSYIYTNGFNWPSRKKTTDNFCVSKSSSEYDSKTDVLVNLQLSFN